MNIKYFPIQLSRLEKYRSKRQPAVETAEMEKETIDENDFGSRSKVSLLDQHGELKKKAEGKYD